MKKLTTRAEHFCDLCHERWWHSVDTGCMRAGPMWCPECHHYDPNFNLVWPDTWDYVDNFAYWVKQERRKAGVE